MWHIELAPITYSVSAALGARIKPEALEPGTGLGQPDASVLLQMELPVVPARHPAQLHEVESNVAALLSVCRQYLDDRVDQQIPCMVGPVYLRNLRIGSCADYSRREVEQLMLCLSHYLHQVLAGGALPKATEYNLNGTEAVQRTRPYYLPESWLVLQAHATDQYDNRVDFLLCWDNYYLRNSQVFGGGADAMMDVREFLQFLWATVAAHEPRAAKLLRREFDTMTMYDAWGDDDDIATMPYGSIIEGPDFAGPATQGTRLTVTRGPGEQAFDVRWLHEFLVQFYFAVVQAGTDGRL